MILIFFNPNPNPHSGSEEFKTSAFDHCNKQKEDTIAYQSHSMEVSQAAKDFKFEVNRCLSDIYRLQELYMAQSESMSSNEMIANWSHVATLSRNLTREAS